MAVTVGQKLEEPAHGQPKHALIDFLVRLCSVCRHLPWAWLKTLSLLSQVQAQVAQKNVHGVESRWQWRSSLHRSSRRSYEESVLSSIVSRLEALAADQQPEDWLNLKSKRQKRGKLLCHRYQISRFAQRGASIDRNATLK